MNTSRAAISALARALRIPRFVFVFSFALALLALPAFHPENAGAMMMSEAGARRACFGAGGTMHYGFFDSSMRLYDMTCTLPSGAAFYCYSYGRNGHVECA